MIVGLFIVKLVSCQLFGVKSTKFLNLRDRILIKSDDLQLWEISFNQNIKIRNFATIKLKTFKIWCLNPSKTFNVINHQISDSQYL